MTTFKIKSDRQSGVPMSATPVTQEAEVGGLRSKACPGKVSKK
jgi:hypothetical protein